MYILSLSSLPSFPPSLLPPSLLTEEYAACDLTETAHQLSCTEDVHVVSPEVRGDVLARTLHCCLLCEAPGSEVSHLLPGLTVHFKWVEQQEDVRNHHHNRQHHCTVR